MPAPDSPVYLAERRAWIYWSADGLPSIVIGIGCLTMAFLLFTNHSQLPRLLDVILVVGALGLYSFIVLGNRQILDWLKSRLTYPRTGYVAPPYSAGVAEYASRVPSLGLQNDASAVPEEIRRARRFRSQTTLLLFIPIVLVAIAALLVSSPWINLVLGFTVSAALWWGTRFDRSLSWLVIIGFVLLGFYMFFFSIPPSERLKVLVAGSGVLFTLGGTATFIRYLFVHPKTNEEPPN